MRLLIIVFLWVPIGLLAYSDADMDGVEDAYDKCPNTPLTELADIHGCSKESLVSYHHYDIILGASFANVDYNTNEATNTATSTAQVDYYYKDFSLQASTSYFSSDSQTYSNSGLNDSVIAGYYQFRPLENVSLRGGLGMVIPTYDSGLNNNNLDYLASISVSYSTENINIFGGYSYTLVNDDDINSTTVSVTYQNTNSYNVGLGFYPTQKLYWSVSYNNADSIYQSVEPIESVSTYLFYNIDAHWFSTLSYAYGLSDSASDHYGAIRFGYYF